MDCFFDGVSDNWKLCWSGGCFASSDTGKTVQNPPAVRLAEKKVVTLTSGTCSALPALSAVGGEAFLSTLAATLNIYRDRINNAACGGQEPDYMDTLVGWGAMRGGVRSSWVCWLDLLWLIFWVCSY